MYINASDLGKLSLKKAVKKVKKVAKAAVNPVAAVAKGASVSSVVKAVVNPVAAIVKTPSIAEAVKIVANPVAALLPNPPSVSTIVKAVVNPAAAIVNTPSISDALKAVVNPATALLPGGSSRPSVTLRNKLLGKNRKKAIAESIMTTQIEPITPSTPILIETVPAADKKVRTGWQSTKTSAEGSKKRAGWQSAAPASDADKKARDEKKAAKKEARKKKAEDQLLAKESYISPTDSIADPGVSSSGFAASGGGYGAPDITPAAAVEAAPATPNSTYLMIGAAGLAAWFLLRGSRVHR